MHASIIVALLTISFSPSKGGPTDGIQEHPSPNGHDSPGVPVNRESHSPILDLNRLPEEQPGAILPQQRQGAEDTQDHVEQPPSTSRHLASPPSTPSFGGLHRIRMRQTPLSDSRKEFLRLLELKNAHQAISVPASSSSSPRATHHHLGAVPNPLFDARRNVIQERLAKANTKDVGPSRYFPPRLAIAVTHRGKTTYISDWYRKGRESKAGTAKASTSSNHEDRRHMMSMEERMRTDYEAYQRERKEKELHKAKEKGNDKATLQSGNKGSGETATTTKAPQANGGHTAAAQSKQEEAGSSSNAAKDQKKRYYQDPRPPYIPPEWMSEEVKQYYKHWYAHADEVQKFNRGERSERPRIEGSVPFGLQHALELKERKTKEDAIRKKSKIQRTPAQDHRDFEEWRMIHDGQNLRMRIMQLHRHAVAKELGIPVDKVTHDIGLQHGVPYGPFNQTKKRKGDETDVASSSRSKRRRSGASSDAGPTRHTSKKEKGKGKKVMKKV